MSEVTRLSFDKSDDLECRRLHLGEISPDVDTPLQTVGQVLSTARKRIGNDLALVAQRLKIRKVYLNALEESNFDLLPGRVYAVGFVRTYSQYLGLETSSLVERYKAEIVGFKGSEDIEVCLRPELERNFPKKTGLFVAFLLISLAYGAYHLQTAANQMLIEREVVIPAHLEAVISEQPVEDTGPSLAQSESVLSAAGLVLVSELNEPVNNEIPAVYIQNAVQNLPAGETLGLINTNSRIMLRIHETTSVRIVGVNNKLFINRTLSPRDTYQAPNIAGMRIWATNSGAVELIVDGRPSGFLGARGAEANALSLNPQDIVDRAQ